MQSALGRHAKQIPFELFHRLVLLLRSVTCTSMRSLRCQAISNALLERSRRVSALRLMVLIIEGSTKIPSSSTCNIYELKRPFHLLPQALRLFFAALTFKKAKKDHGSPHRTASIALAKLLQCCALMTAYEI